MTQPCRKTLCLAASGGGHLRQILDLEPLWGKYPHFFVTEDTPMGRSVAARGEIEFVPHFALGQARLGSPLKMLGAAWRSFWRSLGIVGRRRPDVVITTGAGSQLFIVMWARLFGATIVLIDSFARFDGPSAFARLAGPLAHLRIAQSAASAAKWPRAVLFDPLEPLETAPPAKEALLLATVGATLPFERLTQLVLAAKRAGHIDDQVILQVGDTDEPFPAIEGVRIVKGLSFEEMQALSARARIVVTHGGTGSIITALRAHCRTIVIPRRFDLGEHYDDHQEEITRSFEARDLILSAYDETSLRAALKKARSFIPKPVTTNYRELISYLEDAIR